MGPQKSRGLYRVNADGSNRLLLGRGRLGHQPMACPLGRRASQTDLRYHGAFL
jgi:hypothetical protein